MTSNVEHPTGICGIGASAGGLEPLAELIAHFPTESGVAVVVAQHLSPDHESMMPRLLGRKTSMPVHQAEDGTELQPDNVYVLGPGDVVTVDGHKLVVHDRPTGANHTPSRPIDSLFESLASWQAKAAAIVLSGTGSDGTRGVAAVREAGGLTLAQDESALFADMPAAAVDSGFVNAVGPPLQLATWAVDFLVDGNRPPGASRFGPVESNILGHLEAVTGINFEDFKHGTVLRRLEHRMQTVGAESLDQLAERVSASREEAIALSQDILVGVTQFFRDPLMWRRLEEKCLDDLVREASKAKRPLRCWIAGCATGQEAYTLAMLLDEARARIDPNLAVKIFATDVHDRALATARDGLYSEEELAGIDPERREAYFQAEDGRWRVVPELRAMIAFSNHNLLVDAPFTRIDLLACRNTLIYFTQSAQLNALWAFGFALRRGGVLVLGDSEALGPAEVDFNEVVDQHRIFRKVDDRVTAQLKRARQAYNGHLAAPTPRRFPGLGPNGSPGFRSGERALNERVALAAHSVIFATEQLGGLVFSPGRELLHVIGGATNWLRFPAGATPPDAVRLIEDPALRLGVEAVLRQLRADEVKPAQHDLTISLAATRQRVRLRGAVVREGQVSCHVVYATAADRFQSDEDEILVVDGDAQSTIDELQAELAAARSQLNLALAQQDASMADLAASNEELMVANEELQTSMEELSSVNEELRTVADENEQRLVELLEIGADLEQILDATEIAVVLLDSTLRIRRFSEPARRYFNLLATDIGRPFTHLRASIPIDDLEPAIERARLQGETTPIRSELPGSEETGTILTTVAPYAIARGESGVSVRLVDITPAWEAERERRLAADRLATSLDTTGVVTIEHDLDGTDHWASSNFEAVVGHPPAEWHDGFPALDIVHPDDHEAAQAVFAALRKDAAGQPPYPLRDLDLRIVSQTGSTRHLDFKAAADRVDGRPIIRAVAADVGHIRYREHKLAELNEQLQEFVRVTSHDLRSPLRAIRRTLELAEDGSDADVDTDLLRSKVDRVDDLLDDLLAYARSEERRGQAREVEPADLVNSIFDMLDIPEGVSTSVTSTVDSVVVEAIPLATAIRNLVDQALRRTAPGDGEVEVTVTEEGENLKVVVADDGDPTRLRQPESDPFRTLYRSGFGIGLETIHNLLKERGGTLEVEQPDGGQSGTTVVLKWPLAIDLRADGPATPAMAGSTDRAE
jgi:two-component system CheB/CheR fusion protein